MFSSNYFKIIKIRNSVGGDVGTISKFSSLFLLLNSQHLKKKDLDTWWNPYVLQSNNLLISAGLH